MIILLTFPILNSFLLEGKQDLSVGEFDIMQICIVFKGSLVLISISFYVLCVYFVMKVITLPFYLF